MRVSEVMKHDSVCCIRTTSVMNAVRMLREFDIGFLPVIDDLWTRKLIGVVTDRDLCLATLGEQHDPTLTTVEDCMATDPVTCTRDKDIPRDLGSDGGTSDSSTPGGRSGQPRPGDRGHCRRDST